MAPSSRPVTFPGPFVPSLAARLDAPAGPPLAYAIFAHCFTCSKESKAAAAISAALAERGFAVLRFDFTGLGGSEGDFANTNFSSNVDDLVAAADFLRREHRAPALLVGHSLGGTAVLAAAPRIPEAAAVATIGSPFDPEHVLGPIKDSGQKIDAEGDARVGIAGRDFRIKKQFLDDIRAQKIGAAVERLGKALMVMHSPRDAIVNIDNAARIFIAAKHPKSYVSLDPADHLLLRREDALYAGEVLAVWASRYVAPSPEAAPALAAGAGVVSAARECEGAQHILSRPPGI